MTLRELIAAAKAKQKSLWDHTADLMALIASAHFKGKFDRDSFHPLREKPKFNGF